MRKKKSPPDLVTGVVQIQEQRNDTRIIWWGTRLQKIRAALETVEALIREFEDPEDLLAVAEILIDDEIFALRRVTEIQRCAETDMVKS